jgi:glycosyltransferase involved in cell wall biosynthesis
MKVAVISHAYQDERYLVTLESMAEFPEVEVALIHPRNYKGTNFHWNSPHSVHNISVPVIFGSRQGTILYHPWALETAFDCIRPDLIVHEQEVYTLGAGQVAAVARRRSIPRVQFVWENVHRSLALPRRVLSRYVLAKADAVMAGSSQAMQVHKDWGSRGPFGVVPQMSVNVGPAPNLGRRGTNALKVCFVGRLEPCKGVDCLLPAVAELHRRGFAITLALAGKGPERDRLARLAKELGIWSLVQFHGQLSRDDVRRLLRSSDVLVLPSRRTRKWEEQFGLVLAEAMAEATVVVGSRTGAIPEVIGSEDLLFDEDKDADLAEVLRRLAIDDDFFLSSQLRLWMRARDMYRADRVAAQKVRFLRGILDKLRAPASEPARVGGELRVPSQ